MARITGTPRTLRAINDRVALELLLRHGRLSRSQLVELTGMSKPTASEVLGRLEVDGLVVQHGTTSGSRGPSAQLYSVNAAAAHVAAVNVEDELVTASVADITGRVLSEACVDEDFTRDIDPVPAVRSAVRTAARRAKVPLAALRYVVVGVRGAYDPVADAVRYAGHLPGWERDGVVQRLRDALGAALTVENDANLAAVGERTRGAATEVETFALLWVGHGLGLAVELGGRLYHGGTGGAGEIGYMPVGGRSATFQDSVGGMAVVALARRYGLVAPGADDVVRMAFDHEHGEGFLRELAERLASGVATIAAVLDPPLIVMAGPTCTAGGQYLVDLTSEELRRISPFRTPLALTAVEGSPVLAGATDSAVALARDDVLGNVGSRRWTPSAPPSSARAEG